MNRITVRRSPVTGQWHVRTPHATVYPFHTFEGALNCVRTLLDWPR